MSTRCTIKYSRPDDAPGYHLFDDVLDFEDSPPVYLELFGVEAEVSTSGYVHVVIPRAMAQELGLLSAPTSAAGATKPNELTSSPEPAPALRAAPSDDLLLTLQAWGRAALEKPNTELVGALLLRARDALLAAAPSGLLPVAREGLRTLTKAECHELAETVGLGAVTVQRKFCEVNGIPQPASGDAPGEAK